jgi:hypothetical protein
MAQSKSGVALVLTHSLEKAKARYPWARGWERPAYPNHVGTIGGTIRMGPQLSQGPEGDRINVVLAAAGYNLYGADGVKVTSEQSISCFAVVPPFGSAGGHRSIVKRQAVTVRG